MPIIAQTARARALIFSVAAALASCFLGAQHVQAQAAAAARTDVVLCNNTSAKIYIALVYYQAETKKWTLSAWHARNPRECKSNGRYSRGKIYYFAENEGKRAHWPAKASVERTFCVPQKRIERTVFGGGQCDGDERLLGFRPFDASGERFTFNFNGS